jgi:hypothetical protein
MLRTKKDRTDGYKPISQFGQRAAIQNQFSAVLSIRPFKLTLAGISIHNTPDCGLLVIMLDQP